LTSVVQAEDSAIWEYKLFFIVSEVTQSLQWFRRNKAHLLLLIGKEKGQ